MSEYNAVELTECAEGLRGGRQQKSRVENFDLNYWKREIPVYQDMRKGDLGREYQEFSFGLVFDLPVRITKSLCVAGGHSTRKWPGSLLSVHTSPGFSSSLSASCVVFMPTGSKHLLQPPSVPLTQTVCPTPWISGEEGSLTQIQAWHR